MVTLLKKKRTVISVDLSDDAITKAVLATSNGDRFLLEKWELCSEQNSDSSDLTEGYWPGAVTAVLGDAHTLCFAIPEFDSRNIEIEKRKRGVDSITQCTDYLNISCSGLLASVDRETSKEITDGIKATFPTVAQLSISQSMVALHYLYLRSYPPESELRTALLHCTSNLISLLVVQTEIPIWEAAAELREGETENNYSKIRTLLQTASEKFGGAGYDLLLLAGDCDNEDVKEMRNFASHVELFSPYRNRAFELGRGLGQKRDEAHLQGHRLAVAIGAAGMLLEGVGINLAETDVELERELPIERVILREPTAIDLVLEGFRFATQKTVPFLLAQSSLILASLLIALSIFGYRYREATETMQQLDAEIEREQKRAASLVEIKNRQDEYKARIAGINAKLANIGEIRKKQMTVKAVLDELDRRVPNGLVFTEMEIDETKLKLRGYAPERLAVNTFASQLGQSLGVFTDVAPVYDDKTNIGNYEISCKYVGLVPTNPMMAMTKEK